MRYLGQVEKWFDDKGYGFISTEVMPEQVFFHVSAIGKGQVRPEVGEALTFEIKHDSEKGPQATNVFFPNRSASEQAISEYKATLYEQTQARQEPIRLKVKNIEQVSAHAMHERKQKKPRDLKTVLYMIFFGWLFMTGYHAWEDSTTVSVHESDAPINAFIEQPAMVKEVQQTFQCGGKKHCSEMISCEEATYYLRHCPGTVMDGDGDGLPCEDQWCGH